MSAEFLLFNPHGLHNNQTPGDDGLNTIDEMVSMAFNRGVIPAITSHDSMHGVPNYIDTMDRLGLGRLAIPGVELKFKVITHGLGSLEKLLKEDKENEKSYIFIGAGAELFQRQLSQGWEKMRMFTGEDLEKERTRLREIIEKFWGKSSFDITNDFQSDFRTLLAKEIIAGDLNDKEKWIKTLVLGHWVALTDPAFSLYYLVCQRMSEETGKKGDEMGKVFQYLDSLQEEIRIGLVGFMYWDYEVAKDNSISNQGEMICLMPKSSPLVEKMSKLVDVWREKSWNKTMPLMILFDHFIGNLTDGEYQQLVWYYPHPVSIDYHLYGKILLRMVAGKDMVLFAPEVLNPEIAREIDVIEVLNAAHPGFANKLSLQLAANDLLKNKGLGGGDDAHSVRLVGGAATGTLIYQRSDEGILDALREGRIIPISGWGENSLGWKPHIQWSLAVPIKGRHLTPKRIMEKLGTGIDLFTPQRLTLDQMDTGKNLYEERKEKRGWVYIDKTGKARIYP